MIRDAAAGAAAGAADAAMRTGSFVAHPLGAVRQRACFRANRIMRWTHERGEWRRWRIKVDVGTALCAARNRGIRS